MNQEPKARATEPGILIYRAQMPSAADGRMLTMLGICKPPAEHVPRMLSVLVQQPRAPLQAPATATVASFDAAGPCEQFVQALPPVTGTDASGADAELAAALQACARTEIGASPVNDLRDAFQWPEYVQAPLELDTAPKVLVLAHVRFAADGRGLPLEFWVVQPRPRGGTYYVWVEVVRSLWPGWQHVATAIDAATGRRFKRIRTRYQAAGWNWQALLQRVVKVRPRRGQPVRVDSPETQCVGMSMRVWRSYGDGAAAPQSQAQAAAAAE